MGEEELFLDYAASFLLFLYKDGEFERRKHLDAPEEVREVLIEGWKMNFRLKVLFLYYIFPEAELQEMDLSFLKKEEDKHPLFSILAFLQSKVLFPEEEMRVKFLLKHYEEWSITTFKEDR